MRQNKLEMINSIHYCNTYYVCKREKQKELYDIPKLYRYYFFIRIPSVFSYIPNISTSESFFISLNAFFGPF